MYPFTLARALAVLAIVACTSAARDGVTASTPPGGSAPGPECTPTRSAGSGPIADPSGPYYHQVVIAQTTNGLTLVGAHQVLDHASVPDGVRRADGTVLIYYVNGAGGAVWAARIEGDSARPISAISIDGVSAPAGVVDPDVLPLADGRVRLFYLSGVGTPGVNNPRAICIAESDDGVRFTGRGVAATLPSGELLTDPSVVRLADGTWLMAMSLGQQTVLARSSDGLAFAREATVSFGGVPELAIAPDGALRLYVCAQGIVAYRSTDQGRAWTREATVVGPGFNGKSIVCDPSLVAGAQLFVFKTG
jgi:hypothetical protein